MAQQNDVIVTLKLQGAEQFKNQANGALSSVSKSSVNLKDVATKAFALVAKAALAAGAAMAAVAVKSALTAARTETLGVAMEAVAKATKTSLPVLKAQEKALKKQGITTQESRRILMMFMQSQLDVADATKIARVAQDLAVISGENSSQTAATLTEAIANQNVMMLRQYGIVTTTDSVFEAYAKTLGKSANDLTEVEKRQSFVNKIMEQGSLVAGVYEKSMETAGKKLTSLPRYFEEAANAIGEVFLPVLGTAIDTLTNFLRLITPESMQRIRDSLTNGFRGSGVFEYLKTMFESLKLLWAGFVSGFTQAWAYIQPVLKSLGTEVDALFKRMTGNSFNFKQAMELTGRVIGIVLGGIVLALSSVAYGITKAVNAAIWMRDKMGSAASYIRDRFNSVGSSIASSFKNAINSAISFMNTGLNRIIAGYNKVPILGDIPYVNIPRFAQGGVVPGSSMGGDRVLARVNSGEMVLTRGQQGALFNMLKNMSSNQNINFNAPISFGNQTGHMQQENSFINLLGGLAR